MEKKIKVKKIIWWGLLIIGVLPFIITLCTGIYHSIIGANDGICVMCSDRQLIYGLEAFEQTMIFAIYLFWPVYIIALVLTVLSIIRLVVLKRKIQQ